MKRNCKNCRKVFEKRLTVSKKTWNTSTLYCSNKCASIAWGKQNSGKNHYNWKGGYDAAKYLAVHPEIAENRRQRNKELLQEKRLLVLRFYSKSEVPFCACCKENKLIFLAIDHVNNDGAKHKKEGGFGGHLAEWLIKNKFPKGFQILCHNCNFAKHLNGGKCPHVQGK